MENSWKKTELYKNSRVLPHSAELTSGVPISLCPRPGVYVNPHLTLYGWGKVGEGRSLRGEERVRGGRGEGKGGRIIDLTDKVNQGGFSLGPSSRSRHDRMDN
jgi:hypothetical protein